MQVSALVVMKDAARFVSEAINSIKAEPVSELIIVDDGSTDDSITRAIRAWDNRPLQIVASPRPGIPVARNVALRLATHDHVAWLDADDIWEPGKLQNQFALLGDKTDAVVTCKVVQFVDSPAAPTLMRADKIGVPITLTVPSTMLCHRNVYDRVGGYNEELHPVDDVDWIRRALALGVSVIEAPEVLLRKRIHSNNVSLTQPNMPELLARVLRAK